jgi:hypothetical protein
MRSNWLADGTGAPIVTGGTRMPPVSWYAKLVEVRLPWISVPRAVLSLSVLSTQNRSRSKTFSFFAVPRS